jgi:hypothetical protein
MASAAGKTAFDRATAMLASTVTLRRVMAEQGRILGDLANRRLSGPEVFQKVALALRAWSSESARFTPHSGRLSAGGDQCQLQAP